MHRPKHVYLGDVPYHPVLADPWKYTVTALRASFSPTSQTESSLELDLSRDDHVVTLRFEGVHGLEIDEGFPYSNSGLEILDISGLQWCDTKVRVSGFEPAPGIRFWARTVERISIE